MMMVLYGIQWAIKFQHPTQEVNRAKCKNPRVLSPQKRVSTLYYGRHHRALMGGLKKMLRRNIN